MVRGVQAAEAVALLKVRVLRGVCCSTDWHPSFIHTPTLHMQEFYMQENEGAPEDKRRKKQ